MKGIRTRLAGLVATLLILGIVIGLPLVLLKVGANPTDVSVPSVDGVRDALTSPDDGTLALGVIEAVAWAAWAVLTVLILMEIVARVRGAQVPRLRGLGVPQSAASGLVGAAILLFVAAPLAAPAAAATGTAHLSTATTTSTASTVHPNGAAPAQTATATAPQTARHTVKTGETLWSIAKTRLGAGERYHEIVALNRHLLGDDPGFLRPGWVLELPASSTVTSVTTGAHTVTVRPGDTLWAMAQAHLGSATRYPQIAAASKGILQPGGQHLTDPDRIDVGWTLIIPGQAVTKKPINRPVVRDHPSTSRAGEQQVPPTERARPETPTVPASPLPPPAAAGSAARPAAHGAEARADQGEVGSDHSVAAWMLTGLTGGGAVLAGSAWLALRRRRRAQFRARRPGRTIAQPDPAVAAVEKTITAVGSSSAPTVERMDTILRRLATQASQAKTPIPPVAAVELGHAELVLHLSQPTAMPTPWRGSEDLLRWTCPGDIEPDTIAPADDGQAAPFPLLVTIGSDDEGHVWLLNCENQAAITLTGDPDYAKDFARYLAAEVALNPWSDTVTADCVGIAHEVVAMNPNRLRWHDVPDQAAAEAVADAVAMIDRANSHGVDAATGRGTQVDDDLWPTRLLLLDAAGDPPQPVQELLSLVAQHPAVTGTAIVLAGAANQEQGTVLHLTGQGRLQMPSAGLDLIAVGLTSDEASGCAALLAQSEVLQDAEIPVDEAATDGWRSLTNNAGALRREHTLPRSDDAEETTGCVLASDDLTYVSAAATTEEDLAQLAPQVPTTTRDEVEAADPTLDEDLEAWFADDCPLPRLTLLGPVHARTRGDAVAVAKRKPYATELLAYLATRPHGATPAQLADAFNLSDGRARTDITMVRDWLGMNPRTGRKHLPNARQSAAAKARGTGVYVVEDILVDADLFRRLRARGEARHEDGIEDFCKALTLVTGQPFDQLRRGGWSFLAEGDRIDQHMVCAVVDVAHIVATQCLVSGDLARARAAAELACLAAPWEEIPRLDLAAVAEAEGHSAEAERILREEVCNRSDDGGAPTELTDRTETILRNHDWLTPDQAAS